MTHLAPLAWAGPSAPRPPDHPPMQRLRRAGLRVDEEDFIREAWDRLSPEERTEWYEQVMSDIDLEELRRQIAELRAGGWSEGIAEPESPTVEAEATPVALVFDGEEVVAADNEVSPDAVPDAVVGTVLEWVGEDPGRARAALAAEQRRHDPPRKTLVERVEALSARH